MPEIIFTKHTLERGKEIGLNELELKKILKGSRREKRYLGRSGYKISKYGLEDNEIDYYFKRGKGEYPSLLFTIRQRGEKYIVLTVSKRRLNKKCLTKNYLTFPMNN